MATEGERWTAEALDTLRAGGFTPAAWSTFVAASLERSRVASGQRPALARQAARWGVTGAAAWLAACALANRRDELALRPLTGLAWWGAVWQMLDWHLGMAEDAEGRPCDRLGVADALTLSRLWLVPALPGVASSPAGLPAVIVLGALSDFADGILARAHGPTRLGRDLDTTADRACAPRGRPRALPPRLLRARAAPGAARSPLGGALRLAGLALSTAGRSRAGTALLVAGSLAPPGATWT